MHWWSSTRCHIRHRWCPRALPRHSSIVGDGKSSVSSLAETWQLCFNVSSEWNLPALNSFSLLTREIFNIRTIHLLQNCWFILPCPKKSWINWCQNRKALNCVVWLWYFTLSSKYFQVFSKKNPSKRVQEVGPNPHRGSLSSKLTTNSNSSAEKMNRNYWCWRETWRTRDTPTWLSQTYRRSAAARRAWLWWRAPCPSEDLPEHGAAGGTSSALTEGWNASSSFGTGRQPERTHQKTLLTLLKHENSDLFFGLPCSIWGCQACCWRQSGRLSYQTVCGPHTLP